MVRAHRAHGCEVLRVKGLGVGLRNETFIHEIGMHDISMQYANVVVELLEVRLLGNLPNLKCFLVIGGPWIVFGILIFGSYVGMGPGGV